MNDSVQSVPGEGTRRHKFRFHIEAIYRSDSVTLAGVKDRQADNFVILITHNHVVVG
jgi:hypothetical protein